MTLSQIQSRKAQIVAVVEAATEELMMQYASKKFNQKALEKGQTQIKRWAREQHESLYASI